MEHAFWNRIFLTGQIDTAVASIYTKATSYSYMPASENAVNNSR